MYRTLDPDISAPAVQTTVGHTPILTAIVVGLAAELFQAMQGTSVAASRVPGSAALIKNLYPDWTPRGKSAPP